MLFHILFPLKDIAAFNVFRYITFRSSVAFLLALIISIVWGRVFIRYMKRKQFGQVIRDSGPKSHLKKAGTPTMGGVFIVGSVLLALGVCGNYFSFPLTCSLFIFCGFTLLGLIDDTLKIAKGNSAGVSAKAKLFWQFSLSSLVVWFLIENKVIDTHIYAPFFKEHLFDAGYYYIAFASLVIVGSSNAVNLTDGLDGLAIGPIMTSTLTLSLMAYASGHREIAEYLYIPHIEGTGELAVFGAAVVGASAGFLWYNSYPAEVFMGDVGSLSLGGFLGMMAVVTKNELLFVLIGGVLVVEALSVILQVFSFKVFKKRIFKMTPIHHHFELLGWPEPKVITRFWIISLFLGLISIATLKMR